MPTFVIAIFLSAFLLFQVQPIIARYILPWYGGSPAVWTTCMLFFQVGLLAGYSYAHLLVSRFRNRPGWQVAIHVGLIVLSIAVLPITPTESLRPSGTEGSPVGGILKLLFYTVGLPYVVIAASGPLLQHWFGSVAKGGSPYRLYAVSNCGSLLGLLTYPLVFESMLGLSQQTRLWSGGYVFYVALAGVCAWLFVRSRKRSAAPDAEEAVQTPEVVTPKPASGLDRILWVVLAACGSLLLLATTNLMCQDVAVVPFLWVLPLSLYLLTFIIAFDHARWYFRPFWIPLAVVSIGALAMLLNWDFDGPDVHIVLQIAICAVAMFSACMICHGEMVRLKPDPYYLTSFYLAVSLGGALGGLFVSMIAPLVFTSYWELHLGLFLFAVLAGFCVFRDLRSGGSRRSVVSLGVVLWMSMVSALGFFLWRPVMEVQESAIRTMRGFYGVLRVYESRVGKKSEYRELFHGRIRHGTQFQDERFKARPYSYYAPKSGPGVAFANHPLRQHPDGRLPMNIGVVGLGVGTLAAHALPGDRVRMYEINPQVEELARTEFSYLDLCKGDVTVILGDARISLERELADGDLQQFDVLFVDAFSGDSVPTHLLTREAFELYFTHLTRRGVLVLHITNRF